MIATFQPQFRFAQHAFHKHVRSLLLLKPFVGSHAAWVDFAAQAGGHFTQRWRDFPQADAANDEHIHITGRCARPSRDRAEDKGEFDARHKGKCLLEFCRYAAGLHDDAVEFRKDGVGSIGLKVEPVSITAATHQAKLNQKSQFLLHRCWRQRCKSG
jgi:hypothetical protein